MAVIDLEHVEERVGGLIGSLLFVGRGELLRSHIDYDYSSE